MESAFQSPVSSTTTVTLPREPVNQEPEVVRITLRGQTLHEQAQKKILAMIDEMNSSQLFSNLQMKTELWRTKFSQLNLSLTGDQNKLSFLLFVFLKEIIDSAYLAEQIKENQDKILSYRDSLKEILSPLLPSDVDVDGYIWVNEEFLIKMIPKQNFELRIKTLEDLHKELLDAMTNRANISNQKIVARFNLIKKELLKLNEERQQIMESLHGRIDGLTSRMEVASETIKVNATQVQNVGEKMQNELGHYKQVLQKGSDLKKIKIV
jgi:hypothetical protein